MEHWIIWSVFLVPSFLAVCIRVVAIDVFRVRKGRASLIAVGVPFVPTLIVALLGYSTDSHSGGGSELASVIYLLIPMMVLIGVLIGLVVAKLIGGEFLRGPKGYRAD